MCEGKLYNKIELLCTDFFFVVFHTHVEQDKMLHLWKQSVFIEINSKRSQQNTETQ